MEQITSSSSPREVAYLALLKSLREESFLDDTLDAWRKTSTPQARDYNFCRALAYGSAQMALSLDYFASRLAENQTLKLKLKEKALLRVALYQYYFMNGVPLYALTNESVEIAKRHCHIRFANFLIHYRKLPTIPLELPRINP